MIFDEDAPSRWLWGCKHVKEAAKKHFPILMGTTNSIQIQNEINLCPKELMIYGSIY